MEIKITKDCYGHMAAVEDADILFEFEFRHDADSWYFWLPGRLFDPCVIKGKKFPLEYFSNACRACHFLRKDGGIDVSLDIVGYKNVIVK